MLIFKNIKNNITLKGLKNLAQGKFSDPPVAGEQMPLWEKGIIHKQAHLVQKIKVRTFYAPHN